MSREDLLQQASTVRAHAHAPYSDFQVGAALRTADGRVFTAVNVENATFGLTICAERAAVTAAVAAGAKDFTELAVVSPNGATPCGLCRQTLIEFVSDLPIHLAGPAGYERTVRLAALLPEAFSPRDLPGKS